MGKTQQEKDALNRFKMEAAKDVGVELREGYNGHLTSRQAGSIGGQMVKKMIEAYENGMANETNINSDNNGGQSNQNTNSDSIQPQSDFNGSNGSSGSNGNS